MSGSWIHDKRITLYKYKYSNWVQYEQVNPFELSTLTPKYYDDLNMKLLTRLKLLCELILTVKYSNSVTRYYRDEYLSCINTSTII